MNASRILLDFTRVGNFRAEPGHYMAIQFMPGISGEGDGQNNLWLFDGFRGQFYLDE